MPTSAPRPGPPGGESAAAPLDVVLLTSIDPVLRDSAVADVLCDAPGAAVLRYDLGPERDHGLRRTVLEVGGVVQDVRVPLEHACLGCALREDVLPQVVAAAASGRWRTLVLALPVTAEPVPVLQALAVGEHAGVLVHDVARVRAVVAALSAADAVLDLFGDDTVAERGLGLSEDDGRSVGEALAHQLEEADVVLVDGELVGAGAVAVHHLAGPSVAVLALHAADAADLLRRRRADEPSVAVVRSDLRCSTHPGAPDGHGVWTAELTSPLPFHPGRLLERIEELGGGPVRARGVFWLPDRPTTVCAWDGAGGQLSMGDLGCWEPGETRRTHLVVTGCGDADRSRLEQVFAAVLATPAEARRPGGDDDGFAPWLGPVGAEPTV